MAMISRRRFRSFDYGDKWFDHPGQDRTFVLTKKYASLGLQSIDIKHFQASGGKASTRTGYSSRRDSLLALGV